MHQSFFPNLHLTFKNNQLTLVFTKRVLTPGVQIQIKPPNLYAGGRIVARPFGNNVCALSKQRALSLPLSGYSYSHDLF